MAKHAKYSASQSSQWLNCPGALGMKTLVPKEKTSLAAVEGTAAHELLEKCLKKNLDAYELMDEVIKVKENGETYEFPVDDNMADAVQQCIDLVNSYKEEYPEAEVTIEQKIDISKLCGSKMFGKVDIRIAIPFDRLIIIDYKHGIGVAVDVVENSQLIYYALGSAIEDDFEYDEVELVICQPRCRENEDIQRYIMTIEELKAWAEKFERGRIRSEIASNDIIRVGAPIKIHVKAGSWCKFCPAQAICPAKYDQMIETAILDFDEEDEDWYDDMKEENKKKKDKKLIPQVKLDDLILEQVSTILNSGDQIKKYIDAVFALAENLLETGEDIPGWKLVKKRSNAKFMDNEDTVIKKLVKKGFKKAKITRTKIETLGILRKICGKDVILKMTHNPDTGNTIASEKDKRPAVVPSIVDDFDDL